MKRALVVFAREPKEGKVKTRLSKSLPKNSVLQIYTAFVKDTLLMAKKVSCEARFVDYAGHGAHIPFLKKHKDGFTLKRQMGQGLGERMLKSFQRCTQLGCDKVIIIGTDCLSIFPKEINQAYKFLDRYDCVLGPSRDGGYYLIGLKRPVPSLFHDIPWSSSDVLTLTKRKLREANLTYYLLKTKEDIDTIEELSKASNISKSNVNTLKIVKKVL